MNRPQNTLARLLFGLALMAFAPGPALAHDTVSAGNAKIEFHTDANELLRVNADTTMTFTLTANGKGVKAADCRCTLLLYPGQPSARVKPIQIPLKARAEDPNAISGLVTVTKAGPYSLVLDGKPVRSGSFDPFRVTYELKAAENIFAVPTPAKVP